MLMGDINYLSQLIQDSALPRWLHEYLNEHRERLCAELKLFGSCVISMPDGGTITIRSSGEAAQPKGDK